MKHTKAFTSVLHVRRFVSFNPRNSSAQVFSLAILSNAAEVRRVVGRGFGCEDAPATRTLSALQPRRPLKETALVAHPLDLSEPPAGAHIEPSGRETEKVAVGILACFSPWTPTCSLWGKFPGPQREACGTDRAGHSLSSTESSKPGRFGAVLGEAGRYQDPLDRENIVPRKHPAPLPGQALRPQRRVRPPTAQGPAKDPRASLQLREAKGRGGR